MSVERPAQVRDNVATRSSEPTSADIRTRRWFALAFLGGAVMTLAGCARKNRPEHPPGSEYPRQYPTQ